mmetsp:Transcript_32331/g.77558  ORF Transcript_32331/g.77558 Transcript_32331/m.77558 type:complete len:276 (-) Transcript_32331:401-1228(-)
MRLLFGFSVFVRECVRVGCSGNPAVFGFHRASHQTGHSQRHGEVGGATGAGVGFAHCCRASARTPGRPKDWQSPALGNSFVLHGHILPGGARPRGAGCTILLVAAPPRPRGHRRGLRLVNGEWPSLPCPSSGDRSFQIHIFVWRHWGIRWHCCFLAQCGFEERDIADASRVHVFRVAGRGLPRRPLWDLRRFDRPAVPGSRRKFEYRRSGSLGRDLQQGGPARSCAHDGVSHCPAQGTGLGFQSAGQDPSLRWPRVLGAGGNADCNDVRTVAHFR